MRSIVDYNVIMRHMTIYSVSQNKYIMVPYAIAQVSAMIEEVAPIV